VACHYLILNAQFLAAVHIIVYAGAIMVLFLYVIMLLNLNRNSEASKTNVFRFIAVISAGLLLVVFVGALRGAESSQVVLSKSTEIGLVKNLGQMLFGEFLLPFEIVSILLLAAMVGAVMLGKTHMKRVKEMKQQKNVRGSAASLKYRNINEIIK
jgi:NADH-quinone oxidoreductase subunit J